MKVLADKVLVKDLEAKLILEDDGKIVLQLEGDAQDALERLKAAIPGSIDDVVIDLVEGLLKAQ